MGVGSAVTYYKFSTFSATLYDGTLSVIATQATASVRPLKASRLITQLVRRPGESVSLSGHGKCGTSRLRYIESTPVRVIYKDLYANH